MFSWTEMTIFIILFYFKTMSMLDIQTIAWIEMVCTNLRRFITFLKDFSIAMFLSHKTAREPFGQCWFLLN